MTPWLLGPLLALAPAGCTGEEPQQQALAQASSEVTFASVEQIGPHHMVASVRRTDAREAGDRTVDELIELSWQDWDNFHVRRAVDGEATRETLVAGGRAWVKVGDRWEERGDAEPHRVQLRTTWNLWDAVLGAHRDLVELVPEEREVIEGRPVARYRVQLKPAEERPRNQRWGFVPEAAEGMVWLDEASAVRLKAELTTTARRRDVLRTVRLELVRSNIGGDQGIAPP